jgi:NADH dehydrogenase
MDRIVRRSLIGAVAGALASPILAATLDHRLLGVLIGIAVGVGYSASLKPTRSAHVDHMMAGGALGVPLWGLVSVVALPIFSNRRPEWNAEQMRAHFPALVGWVVYGAALGLLVQVLNDLAIKVWGPELESGRPLPQKRTRVVILGGGFAGMRTAECLEQQFRTDPSIDLTLVSDTNALLFTPMLAEVAGSSLEPSHISTPLRSSLHRIYSRERRRGRSGKPARVFGLRSRGWRERRTSRDFLRPLGIRVRRGLELSGHGQSPEIFV